MDGARLQISGLYCGYATPDRGIVPTLDGIDLSLNRNEFVSIIGPSGCGKSTLFNVIAGLLAPGSGEVALDGKEIVGKPGRNPQPGRERHRKDETARPRPPRLARRPARTRPIQPGMFRGPDPFPPAATVVVRHEIPRLFAQEARL